MTDRDFNRNFLISIGAHAWIFIMAWLAADVFKNVFRNENVEIIRSAIRVDVVGMPKFTVQELKSMTPPVEKVVEETKGAKAETKVEAEDVIKKDDLVIQEESKKKKNSFMNLITDYSNKKIATKDNKKGSKTGQSNNELDTLIIEGNRLSKGTSLTGDFSDQENSEFASYVQNMPNKIRKFWKLPSYLKDQNLKCRLKVYLSASGELLKIEMVEPSGQPEFDARAQNAVREAAPFEKPTATVASRLANYGIILGFPL